MNTHPLANGEQIVGTPHNTIETPPRTRRAARTAAQKSLRPRIRRSILNGFASLMIISIVGLMVLMGILSFPAITYTEASTEPGPNSGVLTVHIASSNPDDTSRMEITRGGGYNRPSSVRISLTSGDPLAQLNSAVTIEVLAPPSLSDWACTPTMSWAKSDSSGSIWTSSWSNAKLLRDGRHESAGGSGEEVYKTVWTRGDLVPETPPDELGDEYTVPTYMTGLECVQLKADEELPPSMTDAAQTSWWKNDVYRGVPSLDEGAIRRVALPGIDALLNGVRSGTSRLDYTFPPTWELLDGYTRGTTVSAGLITDCPDDGREFGCYGGTGEVSWSFRDLPERRQQDATLARSTIFYGALLGTAASGLLSFLIWSFRPLAGAVRAQG